MTQPAISTAMRPKTLTSFLIHMLAHYQPVLIVGRPGIGKTEIGKYVANTIDFDLIMAHPVTDDPTDYKGLPWAEDGMAKFLPFSNLYKLINAKRPTIFFMDDLGQATPAVQAAAMQLILGREINGHKISDHVVFLAATNRREDKAGVIGILEPVKSRFAIVELEATAEDWVEWALEQDFIPIELIAAVKLNPQWITPEDGWKPDATKIANYPCPRNLAEVGRMMGFLPQDLWFQGFVSRLGREAALELNMFIKTYKDLPSPESIIADPDHAVIPTEPSSMQQLVSGLVNRVSTASMTPVVRYLSRSEMPQEFKALFFHYIKSKRADLQDTDEYVQWCLDSQAFTVRGADPVRTARKGKKAKVFQL